jgi:hypothetical protein
VPQGEGTVPQVEGTEFNPQYLNKMCTDEKEEK